MARAESKIIMGYLPLEVGLICCPLISMLMLEPDY
jgi:hypothetical protein